jgi:hypothetical protein
MRRHRGGVKPTRAIPEGAHCEECERAVEHPLRVRGARVVPRRRGTTHKTVRGGQPRRQYDRIRHAVQKSPVSARSTLGSGLFIVRHGPAEPLSETLSPSGRGTPADEDGQGSTTAHAAPNSPLHAERATCSVAGAKPAPNAGYRASPFPGTNG